MSKKLITASALATALLVGGLNNAMAISADNTAVLSQPTAFTALTVQQKVLSKKGIHYRLAPSVDNANRIYRFNDSKKSHRPVTSPANSPANKGTSHCNNDVSRPNPSRKPGSVGRFV